MNKIRIKLFDDNQYSIKYLYRKKVNVYDIEYRDSGNIYTILEDDLDKIWVNSLEVVSYRGYKNFLYKLKANRHFLIAIFISIALLVFFSNIIMNVTVIHSDKDIRTLVLDELYDRGVKPFIFKKSFSELQDIKKKIKDEYKDDIEWLEIIDEGMKYTVRVEERIITKEESEPQYCDIVSTKDAVVLSAVSSKGQTIVAPTDLVKKDSVLISGQIKFNESVKSHVCAKGEVYGNTWYRVSISVPLNHEVKEYTGLKKRNIGLEYGSSYMRIFRVHLDEYEVEKKKLFSIGRFAIYKESVKEYKTNTEIYNENEAKEEALKQAKEKMQMKLDDKATIIDEKVLQSDIYNSIISLSVFYSVKEPIGKRVIRDVTMDESLDDIAKEDKELE